MTENQRLSRGRYGRSLLVKTNERLAAMTALAKEMQTSYCAWACDVNSHSPNCLDFQQRIKEIEENG